MPFVDRGCCGNSKHYQYSLTSIRAVQDFLQMVDEGAPIRIYKRAFGFGADDVDRHLKKLNIYRVIAKAANKIAVILAAKEEGGVLTNEEQKEITRLRRVMWKDVDINEV